MRIVDNNQSSRISLKQKIKNAIINYLELKLELYLAVGLIYSGYRVVAGRKILYMKQDGKYRTHKVRMIQFKVRLVTDLLLLVR